MVNPAFLLLAFCLLCLWLADCKMRHHNSNEGSQSQNPNFTPLNNGGNLRIAFCLTGQLARFEILSKIRNVFLPNAKRGHYIENFILLDPNVSDVKQTYYRYDYSNNPYGHMNRQDMKAYVDSIVTRYGFSPISEIRTRTKFQSVPQRNKYAVIDEIPVTDKTGPLFTEGIDLKQMPAAESAEVRFQNNMRWLSTLRECVKWIQQVEHSQKWFFDIVVRIRDDSYIFGPWLFSREKYKNSLVSADFNQNFGINDHNFAVDRYWADSLLRGVTEDYYFNETLDGFKWVNPERRIYKVATSLNIPLKNATLCELPAVPLRGRFNKTHWRMHPSYSSELEIRCMDILRMPRLQTIEGLVRKENKGRRLFESSQDINAATTATTSSASLNNNFHSMCCRDSWLRMLRLGIAAIDI